MVSRFSHFEEKKVIDVTKIEAFPLSNEKKVRSRKTLKLVQVKKNDKALQASTLYNEPHLKDDLAVRATVRVPISSLPSFGKAEEIMQITYLTVSLLTDQTEMKSFKTY